MKLKELQHLAQDLKAGKGRWGNWDSDPGWAGLVDTGSSLLHSAAAVYSEPLLTRNVEGRLGHLVCL